LQNGKLCYHDSVCTNVQKTKEDDAGSCFFRCHREDGSREPVCNFLSLGVVGVDVFVEHSAKAVMFDLFKVNGK